jgi:hypothetical protein
MPLGYFGYLKLANIFLLTNSGGLNRQVDPILSEAVWGAGWYTGSKYTNFADGQQHFAGSFTIELQGIPSVWNLLGGWIVENRVTPQGAEISPNGITVQNYTANTADPRTGLWLRSAAFTVAPDQPISLNCDVVGLRRTETHKASSYKAIRVGPGVPTAPLNPTPTNRNPFPGWSAQTQLSWPGSPPIFTDANPTGFVLMGADWTFSNNTQIIKGCTGSVNPAAVMQGTMAVEGTVRIWRDGPIPDPYDIPGQPFTATGANLSMTFGTQTPKPQILIKHVLLQREEFTIQGQDSPIPRSFGFAGLGDGLGPPMAMPAI